MTVAIVSTAGVVVAAALALIGVWLSDRTQYKRLAVQTNQSLVDNLQEERREIKHDVSNLKRQVAGLMLQGRYKDDYINALRDHIERELPPPPPSYPTQLLHIASEGL